MSNRHLDVKKGFDFVRQRCIDHQLKIFELNKEVQESKEVFKEWQLNCLSELFEVLDILERLSVNYEGRLEEMDDLGKALYRSIKGIQKKILRILKKRDIELIAFLENKADMFTCKVLETREDPNRESGVILSIVKNGYINTKNKEVLRKAEVITVKN